MWKLNRFDLDRVGGTAERKITAPAKTLASPTLFKEAPHSSYSKVGIANMYFPLRKEKTEPEEVG
ncbi:hypothetical protein N7541_006912 [Penicillium brevicompactum]|uniref:Uncharacterized protein n=1 Tax=Penicillium brevicompactum TaxID=5074 RepID=A0A9W9QXL7_PENBR|nr:hypothetical protein N7541_006912 [Penicillium brevicompactum]